MQFFQGRQNNYDRRGSSSLVFKHPGAQQVDISIELIVDKV